MATKFPGLEPMAVHIGSPLNAAQRYLAASYDSVASFVEVTYPALRAQRTGKVGRLTEPEQDLFRSAVVVAGAGVDTVLKEALRGCLALRIAYNADARGAFLDWVTQYLQSGQAVSPRRMAELLTTVNAQNTLREAYLGSLTGSSLQSQSQVTTVLGALGFHPKNDRQFYVDAATLNPLFKVRNQIAHEMDMTPSAARGNGERTRRDRTITTYVDLCHVGLNYSQKVLNRLEELMNSGSTAVADADA